MTGKNSRKTSKRRASSRERAGGRGRVRQVLITGYPGFLGKRLVAQLLADEPQSHFYLLVQEKFLEDARKYVKNLRRRNLERVRLLSGDIADMHLGLAAAEVKEISARVTDIYHLAAISYLRVPEAVIWRVNVEGTSNVLDLAGECRRLRRFNHMSSCYVSGNRKGVVMEEELDEGQSFRNPYERTKFEAEKLVRRAAASLPVSIYRPAIVVGDSRTGEIGRFDGPYYLGMLLASSPVAVPLPLPGRGEAPVNMVPVDYVTTATCALSRDRQAEGLTFHLVDPNPLSARRIYHLLAQRTGRKTSRLRVSVGLAKAILKIPGLEKVSRAHRQALDYLDTMTFYNHQNSDRLLLSRGITCPAFDSYLDRLIEYVKGTVAARRQREDDTDPLA